MPPPSKMLRKILIKNKRLKPEVEKVELELYKKGELEIGEEASEDTDAKPAEGAAAAPAADGKPAAPAHTGSTTNVHPLLSSIVNYTWPIHFGGEYFSLFLFEIVNAFNQFLRLAMMQLRHYQCFNRSSLCHLNRFRRRGGGRLPLSHVLLRRARRPRLPQVPGH